MNPDIAINSLSINKLNSHDDFSKYDIEVSLDETESSDSGVKLKYGLVLLSNPTNIKISMGGIISIFGTESEVSKQLESDQKNIPVIVSKVYQEIFPLIYILSKSLQIPCPAYKLSQISSSKISETADDVLETKNTDNTTELTSDDMLSDIKTEQSDSPEPLTAQIIEPNVSSNQLHT